MALVCASLKAAAKGAESCGAVHGMDQAAALELGQSFAK
jgi:hypothetical protein